ncbi:NAD-glutamate dehydrogenase [Planosporangium flavigriseum]|uniref:NAD-glutamate dehydrogenase n=1 Tax=Planosporangium flavigriseum TaxID=373681 RepID=A0A8J3PLX1_9ACTN|nr:NAD-glutamate dehydrogenase [Planosporangium flavigriseum]NJC64220.1 NAD-glutamate dehydrogenase [Planosporangium flavigriseum]GIG74297.1 NAD-glutamate dehydrogenase [Planosporangium flavigriseum]
MDRDTAAGVDDVSGSGARVAQVGLDAATLEETLTGTGGLDADPANGWPGADGALSRVQKAAPAHRLEGGLADDVELEHPLPNAERLVTDAIALATDTGDRGLAKLVGHYWRLVTDEELVGRTAPDLVAATESHRELAGERLRGQLKLRVTPAAAAAEHTAIEIVTDDMPFLVDSVTAALSSENLDIHLLAHPLVVVRREPLGALREIRTGVEPSDADPGDIVESWMRIEVDRIRDEKTLEQITNDLNRVLTDVREAVEDWPKMRLQALALADELAGAHLPVPDKDITDSVELLRWLVDDHFTFLGYREYRLVDSGDGERLLEAVLGTGLGILRADRTAPRVLSSMTPEAYAKALEKRLLIITKANSRATVHRSAYLDYVGFKIFDNDGNVVGERRFLGLFSSSAYRTSVRDLPVVKRKVNEVIQRSGLSPRSHSGKDLLEILETYPRDELFQIGTEELYRTVMGVLRTAGRRQLRLFLRRDAYGRFISCLVYLPRDRFTTPSRLKLQEILLRELNGVGVDYTTRVSESLLARIHFIVRTDPANPPRDIDVDALIRQLSDAIRLWDADFKLVLERKLGEEQAKRLCRRYSDALPDAYKDEHTPREAAKDIAKLELLDEPGQLAMHVYRRRSDDRDVRFKVFRYGEPMMLSTVLPVLHSLGVRVTDERPYEVQRDDASIYLYDFGLSLPADARELADTRPHMENAFSAVWHGEAEIDGFNALVLTAGLTWRQVVVLRAYTKYLRQAGTVYSQEYMEETFLQYPGIAALLVALFETRFDPRLPLSEEDRAAQARQLTEALDNQLDAVTSLDQDRILRAYLNLIAATLRTSFFQRSGGRPKSYVAFKLDPKRVPDLPEPRPKYEIFVYSPRFEGVHLRFGDVARGGLRWSDRREDFRTEILGLVKAQMVKNAVIVPTGAKGGFVLKRAVPSAGGTARAPETSADREAYQAEGVECYKLFISAMLDVTDNLDGATVVPPAEVVRYDDDDPYLVVAADKGTASFSDIANEISLERGFWMGDAFASGGSAGYDHKKMGITARGAWESVKRHFRELGRDIQNEDFTVVGVGDMSGDVFGNGMLLSEHIRLVAAFDHRHIFVDPAPDAASSDEERRRLFELPRSSWADYDTSRISKGGGVWPRTAKSIPVSPEMGEALGLDSGVTSLSPVDLIKAILKAPVDLLWNGGIGTYVKASSESHAEVGDKTNDPVRVNGRDLRCKVVGEGGNLGLTQRGRVEFASRGGYIYTDFIDNSAGVDCSDHEVNIKILLGAVDLDFEQRNVLLAEMTDEVGELVLRDNYAQACALGNARVQSRSLLPVHRRMIADLEQRGQLNRELEALPGDDEMAARAAEGIGLTTPEFAVLLSYTKIALEHELRDSALPDEEWTGEVLVDYFPTPLRERYADQMRAHPLRREIVVTQLVNEAVNRGGTSFAFRAMEETGASAADVLRAYVVVREVFGLRGVWEAVESLDNQVHTEAQTAVYLEMRRLLDRAVRWLVSNRRSPLDVPAEIARFRPGVTALLPKMGTLFRGLERRALRTNVESMVKLGLPEAVAEHATRLFYSFGLLDIVETTHTTGCSIDEVAGVYFALSERLRVDPLLSKISALPREDRWQTMARMALRYDLYAALAGLTAEVLAATPSGGDAEKRVLEWEQANTASIARIDKAMVEFDETGADLAALSVLLRQIRTLVRTTAA